jgi:hypothetical protein
MGGVYGTRIPPSLLPTVKQLLVECSDMVEEVSLSKEAIAQGFLFVFKCTCEDGAHVEVSIWRMLPKSDILLGIDSYYEHFRGMKATNRLINKIIEKLEKVVVREDLGQSALSH